MAFGRSNSLSINTGASTSLFGQQTQPAQQQSSLFGAPANNANATGQSTSLFGGTPTQAPTQQSNLFGNLGASTQPSAQQTNLFGAPTNTAQPAAQPTSLFGNTNTSTSQPGAQSSNVFGNTSNNIFGKSTNNAAGSATNQSSLFGAQSNSLFSKPATAPTTTSLFGNTAQTTQNSQIPTGSIFGMTAVPINQLNQTSLLGASQFRQTQSAPFAGRLTMGQNSAPSTNTTAVGAVRVSLEEMRPTTRFQDLIDPLKEEFEKADKMIQAQEGFHRQIEALRVVHDQNVQSVAPDVALITEKADLVEQILASDAKAVQEVGKITEKDGKDFERCRRIAENLAFPATYHLPHSSSLNYGNLNAGQQRLAQPALSTDLANDAYDTDMIGGYFIPLAKDLQRTIETYASNLAEIESHMKVIENSAVTQAQQLAARRSGANSQINEQDTVRDLADTLRGFEHSILGVAASVGQCREGVTELALGRLSNHIAPDRGRQPR